MNDLIWIGNTLYPRWVALLALGLMVISAAGVVYGLQMFVRRLLQRDGKIL